MRFKSTFRTAVGTSILLLWVATPGFAQQGAAGGQWSYYAGDIGSTKYAPLDQINEDNVRRLRIAWRRPAVDQTILDRVPDLSYTRNLTATPLMVDGIGYTSNAVGLAEAFDPGTGETVWVQEPMDPGPQAYRGAETRGVAYWTDGRDQRILVQRGQYLIVLNAKSGQSYPDFGEGGRVNLAAGLGESARYRWTGAPLVVGDVVVMGQSMGDTFITKEAVRGDVRAFDVRTGQLRWVFHRVYPGFPTLFWGLSGFFVNDLMGKALWSSWKTRSVFQGAVGAFCASTAPSASTGPICMRQDRRVLGLQSTRE